MHCSCVNFPVALYAGPAEQMSLHELLVWTALVVIVLWVTGLTLFCMMNSRLHGITTYALERLDQLEEAVQNREINQAVEMHRHSSQREQVFQVVDETQELLLHRLDELRASVEDARQRLAVMEQRSILRTKCFVAALDRQTQTRPAWRGNTLGASSGAQVAFVVSPPSQSAHSDTSIDSESSGAV